MSKTIKLNQMDFKITEEELKLVQENQGKMNQALNQVGVLEAQKYGLLGYVQQLNKEVEDNKKRTVLTLKSLKRLNNRNVICYKKN